MKILIEEIVQISQPTSELRPDNTLHTILRTVAPGERFRRQRLGVYVLPEINVIAEIIGEPLIMGVGAGARESGKRREVYAVDLRLAALQDTDSSPDEIGFILDVVSPEIYKWLDEDDSGPKDYTDFCAQESIPL